MGRHKKTGTGMACALTWWSPDRSGVSTAVDGEESRRHGDVAVVHIHRAEHDVNVQPQARTHKGHVPAAVCSRQTRCTAQQW